MPRVLITRRLPDVASALLRDAGHEVDILDADDPAPRRRLLERVAGVAGLLPTLSDRVDDELLDAAGASLRVVANYAVGYDNIDVAACRRRGIIVTNTPDVLTGATAELTWALILATARRLIEADRLVRSGCWSGWQPMQLLGVELAGRTLGIVGAGRIGAAVARIAPAFGMHVCYSHPRPNHALERDIAARRLDLPALLEQSDVVSLHVPLTDRTRHLIGPAELERMKPSAILINTARGPVVDEAALVEALRSGQIRAAGLDVYEHEPALTPGLAGLDNVVLLPHIGSATERTRAAMAELAARNIIEVLSDRRPLTPVQP